MIFLKNKKAFCFWAFASAACMVVIFLASSQTAEDSGELSASLTQATFASVWSWFAPGGKEISAALLDTLETVLRKMAHLSVFFIFGVSAANCIRQLTDRKRFVFLVSICWCSVYAASDELHQVFVPGRAGMWQDWLLDTAGALLGVAAVLLWRFRRRIVS